MLTLDLQRDATDSSEDSTEVFSLFIVSVCSLFTDGISFLLQTKLFLSSVFVQVNSSAVKILTKPLQS